MPCPTPGIPLVLSSQRHCGWRQSASCQSASCQSARCQSASCQPASCQPASCRPGHIVQHWGGHDPGQPASTDSQQRSLAYTTQIPKQAWSTADAAGLAHQPGGIRSICGRHHFPAEPSQKRRRVALAGVAGAFTGQYSCQTTDPGSTTKSQGFPQPPTEGLLDAVLHSNAQRVCCSQLRTFFKSA